MPTTVCSPYWLTVLLLDCKTITNSVHAKQNINFYVRLLLVIYISTTTKFQCLKLVKNNLKDPWRNLLVVLPHKTKSFHTECGEIYNLLSHYISQWFLQPLCCFQLHAKMNLIKVAYFSDKSQMTTMLFWLRILYSHYLLFLLQVIKKCGSEMDSNCMT